MPGVEHRSHKSLNNRAENSHLPFQCARDSDQSGACNILFRCSPLFAISSFQIAQNLLPTKFAVTDCKPWPSGKPSAASSSETVRTGLDSPAIQISADRHP